MVGLSTTHRAWMCGFFCASLTLGCTIQGDSPLFNAVDSAVATDIDSTCEIPYPDAVDEIFQVSCGGSSCHRDGGSSGGLNLDSANAVANLVGASANGSSLFRIAAGAPDDSYLIEKVDGTAALQMPLGGTALTADQVTTLREWIATVPDCNAAPDTDVVDSDTLIEDTGVPDVPDPGPSMDAETPMVDPVPQAVADIFMASCAGTSCHTGGGMSGGLALDPDVAAINLVGVASTVSAGAIRVVPKDTVNSVLIQQLGDNSPGLAMPLGGTTLTAAQQQPIIDWINSLDDTPVAPPEDVGQPDAGDAGQPPECVPANEKYETTYAEILNIFQDNCAPCHTGGNSSGGMMLDSNVFLSQTVGVTAQSSALMRINPGSSADSYIIHKLKGEGGVSQMPLNKDPLSDADIVMIESWIDDCARTTAENGADTGK
ncbi:MAG: mono/diheme cytochrome c family protein [Myxococcota bacterium]|jgi:mono/diheme cytochrome c family protein